MLLSLIIEVYTVGFKKYIFIIISQMYFYQTSSSLWILNYFEIRHVISVFNNTRVGR